MTEDALIVALEIVKEDKNWSDKKANKFILETFKELGNGSAVVQKYRKLFQRLLNWKIKDINDKTVKLFAKYTFMLERNLLNNSTRRY